MKFTALFLSFALSLWPVQGDAEMQSLTPVLYVEKIEPSLEFWVDGLGYEKTAEVPGNGGLGFVILSRDSTEIMYQTYRSLKEDVPALVREAKASTNMIFVKVGDIKDVIKSLERFEVVIPRRTTFYGADEIGYREPGGHVVLFAQFKQE